MRDGFLRLALLVATLGVVGTKKKSYSYQYVHREFDDHQPYFDPDTKWFCIVLGICADTLFPYVYTHRPAFRTIYQWSQLEFDYDTPEDRQRDVDSQTFIPGDPAPIDVDVYYGPNNNNKIFVSIPRFQHGCPIALGTITDKKENGNPVIKPYPSWRWHRNPGSCGRDRIVSVYRIKIDECGRLWVLDTGRLLEEQVCPPQILTFDLRTDQLLNRYEIPARLLESRSILVTPIIDIRDPGGKCLDTFVYIADCQTFSIIVYDVRRGVSWKATDKTMYPYPNFGTFDIQGEHFDLLDGVLGMDLSPYIPGQDRKLFYHAMSSNTENWVYTSDLRNQSRFMHDPTSSPEVFHEFKGRRPSQSAAEAIDANGISYFGVMHETEIDCWNTATEYGPGNIDTLERNPTTLQFASGIKVVSNSKGQQELWVITVRFQKVAVDTLSPSEVNFRIQAAKTEDLLQGSKCRPTAGLHQHGGGYRPGASHGYGRRR